MTIPWQAKDSSEQGVLQERRWRRPWDESWGVPQPDPPGPDKSNFFRVGWLEGQGLEQFLQQYVAALLALDGTLVRPRWQAEPVPNLPPFDTPCWAATGIHAQRPIGTYAWVAQYHVTDPAGGPGYDYAEMQRHEELDVLVSLYGPDSDEYAGKLHSNLMVWQNTHLLRKVGMAFVEIGETIWVPDLIKEQWIIRLDKMITLRRLIVRTYPVKGIACFHGRVVTEAGAQAPFGWPKGKPPPPDGITDAEWDNILYVRRMRGWEPGLPLAGGQMAGSLRLARDAQDPLEAATKRQVDIKEGGRY